jgi:CBS domain containing-hemolysin-like protein
LWVAAPLELFLRIFRPIIFAMNGLGRFVVRTMGLRESSGHALIHSEEELRMLVSASTQGGALDESEQEIIDRAFTFADDTAADVMLPRTELVGIPLDATPAEVLATVTSHRLERYPVYEGDSDHVVGVLHARDIVHVLANGASQPPSFDLPQVIRPVLTVPTTLPLDRLLESMRVARTHAAIAIDEYGGTAGMIDLERVIERLVGPMPDEFTNRSANGAAEPDADELDGLTLVQDVNDRYGLRLDEERAHTIGGLVFYELGRTPDIGDTVEIDGARLSVTALDGLRVAAVRIEKLPVPEDAIEDDDQY